MKLTKVRLQKILNNNGRQTRKKFKKTSKILKHTNTERHKKYFNLRNNTLRLYN